ncbi:MAG: hypothetical protein JRN62_03080 [Nitrososphaerota archaeon]|jgi:hypothetical protein|nr:hypothetical protein [Nitrososphaerota archaeon]MDG6948977.1 hypothetical protein [Nitrososphaerota archaeon]
MATSQENRSIGTVADVAMRPVPATVYQIVISDSVMDSLHGINRDIAELYIPAYKVAFNIAAGGRLTVIRDVDPARYRRAMVLKRLKAYPGLVNLLMAYLDAEDKIVKNYGTALKVRLARRCQRTVMSPRTKIALEDAKALERLMTASRKRRPRSIQASL